MFDNILRGLTLFQISISLVCYCFVYGLIFSNSLEKQEIHHIKHTLHMNLFFYFFSNHDYNDRPWRSSYDVYINKKQKYTNGSTTEQ